MGNSSGSHLFQTPSTSPTAATPPRLPPPSSLVALSFDAVMKDTTGASASPCSPHRESMALEDAASTAEARPHGCVEHPCLAERELQEVAFILRRILEQHGGSLGWSSGPAGAAGLLKSLLAEREKMMAEIESLKDTLKTERAEWGQFQSDLRVAVSVADRLRLEAEEALRSLREEHSLAQQRVDETVSKLSQTETELENLRDKLTETQHTLHILRSEHHHTLAELDTFKQGGRIKLCKKQQSLERRQTGPDEEQNQDTMMDRGISQGGSPKELGDLEEMKDLQKPGEGEEMEKQPGGQNEDRKREEGGYVREPRRITMLSERSRSLSQIPLTTHSSSILHGSSQNLTNPVSPVKSQEAVKGRRTDRLLQRQDSWSRSLRGQQEGDSSPASPSVSSSRVRPQDAFSLMLRRHGGSRRNFLLRWCQSRTQGYQNLEITNFSSSWEDGLAFCALYHSYLPTHIPYSSLKPDEKRQNLDLAFHTGECVGIKATLMEEEMLREDGPDWQKVLDYVESMFRHFEM